MSRDSPYRFSPRKPPLASWEINALQTDVRDIRINPVSIDPKEKLDSEALNSLIEENRGNYTGSNNNNSKKVFGYTFGISLELSILLVLFIVVILFALAMYPLGILHPLGFYLSVRLAGLGFDTSSVESR